MPSDGKVFISHAHGDEAPLQALLAALKRWGVDYWLDTTAIVPGHVFAEDIVQALSECDVLVRLSTPAAQHSAWMEREWWIFWALRVLETQQSGQSRRKPINIVFPGHEIDADTAPFEFIDARDHSDFSRRLPDIAWLDELRRALSLPPDVVRFANDDADYFWWLEHYPRGYVLNPYINLREGAPILHRATCFNIGPKGGVIVAAVPKVCAHSREDAQRWAMEHTGYPPVGHINCIGAEPVTP